MLEMGLTGYAFFIIVRIVCEVLSLVGENVGHSGARHHPSPVSTAQAPTVAQRP